MKICIDTNIYSQFKAGNKNVVELLENADQVVVPAIVLGELYAGFYMGKYTAINIKDLEEFLNRPGIITADITKNTAERYAFIVNMLKKIGTHLPTNDIWVAAVVFETGTVLATFDNHFKQIPGIMLAVF